MAESVAARRLDVIMPLFRRGLRYLLREFLRPLPHGLLNWRYLFPCHDTRVRYHRHFWWNGPSHLPRVLWLLLEVWLWLRWIGFEAWLATWRAVREFGPDVRKQEGLTLAKQAWRTLSLSLAWCIPPIYIYDFRLYRNPTAALDYIYDHETAAYHRWRSRPLGFTQASLTLLQDKLALAEKLTVAGLPMAPILACVSRTKHEHADLQVLLLTQPQLFCKTRTGSAGIGAFAVWDSPMGLRGRMLDGTQLETAAEVESAWRELLVLDDALIQTQLKNHPDLQALSIGDDAITVRLITQSCEHGWRCLNATIEIPAGSDPETRGAVYVFLPIEPVSGHLLPCPNDALLTEGERQRAGRVSTMLNPALIVPGWTALNENSYRAHKLFPDIREIAWDWVVTQAGPLLLEGNSVWSTSRLQILQGGLLKGQ